MITVALIIASSVLALVYARRVHNIQYGKNDWSFVLNQSLIAFGCGATAVSLFNNGVSLLAIIMILTATVYLIRSRDTYAEETTKPGDLDPINVVRLGIQDLERAWGKGPK